MGQFVHDGILYEELPNGKARVVGPAQDGGQGGQVFSLPPDPAKALEAPIKQAQLDKLRTDLANRGAPTLPQGYRWRGGVVGGEAEPIPGLPPNVGAVKLSAKERADAIAGYNSSQALEQRIREIEQQFAAGPGRTSGVAGLQDYNPFSTTNQQFDAAGNAARAPAIGSLGFTASQLNTELEGQRAVGPYLPQSSDRDAVILDKIARLKDVARSARERAIAQLGGVPDANGNITPVQGSSQLRTTHIPQDQIQLATGGTKVVDDPETAAIIDRMVRAGANAAQINAALPPGHQPVTDEAVSEAQRYLKKNPGFKSSIGGATKTVPIANPRLNAALQTPLGTAAAQYLNMGGFGLPQALAGEDGFQALSDKNPLSSAAGQVGGVLTGTGGIRKAASMTAGKAFPALLGGGGKGSFARNLLTDMAYGAGYGGITEGDPVKGAAVSGVGSVIGQGAASGIGRTLEPVLAPAAKRLADNGTTLSLGQIMRSRGGLSGRLIGGIEDRLAGLPGIGDMIQGVRTRGLEDANVADLNRVVSSIGGKPIRDPGHAGFAAADASVGRAYDEALDPMRLQATPAFEDALNAAGDHADIIRQNMTDGVMTGEQFQAAKRLIDEEKANLQRQPGGYKVIPQLDSLRGSLFDLAKEQTPDLLQNYMNADKAYAALVPIRTATANAGNNRGVYTPAQLGVALRSTDRTVGKSATAKGMRPNQQFQQDAQEILPSKVPDSGTIGRAVVAGLATAPIGAGSVGLIDPKTAALLSLPALAYTKGGQKVVQKMLLGERPAALQATGKALRKKKGLFGSGAASLLLANQ